MNWKRIPKENSQQPAKGTYKDWKHIVKEECFERCIYCSIHDSRFGGIRNFTVEHYKPKSKPEFKHLENDIKNLYYACSICNSFKNDDWHDVPNKNFNCIGYPDPSSVDYTILFEDVNADGILKGKYTISKYMIERLYLNRGQMILDRKLNILESRIKELQEKIISYKNQLKILAKKGNKKAIDYLGQIVEALNELITINTNVYNSSPYTQSQIQK